MRSFVSCRFDFIRILRTSFRKCIASGNVYRGNSPSKILYFFFYEINFHDKWYSHLKTPKKNTTLFMTFGFSLPFGRFVVRHYACRINVFRFGVFLDMRKKFELFQQPKKGTQYIVDAEIDPCCDIDSSEWRHSFFGW